MTATKKLVRPTRMVPLDQNGHRFTSQKELDLSLYDTICQGGVDLPMWGAVHLSYTGCTWCGMCPELTEWNGRVVAKTPCPSPNGITTTIRFNVKAGMIVVNDDLREQYPIEPEVEAKLRDYNTAIGQADTILEYAKMNLAYGPVGNSCPTLFRVGPTDSDTYVIANAGFIEADEIVADEDEEILPPDWTAIAGITTDLWAYSLAEYGDFRKRGGEIHSDTSRRGYGAEVVHIPAGQYDVTHHTGERDFHNIYDDECDTTKPVIYATLKRVVTY